MSSALVLMLTTAMTVPGNGPEMVSGEVEQGLDLRGEWEGEWQDESGRVWSVRNRDGSLTAKWRASSDLPPSPLTPSGAGNSGKWREWEMSSDLTTITDEGGGNLRWGWDDNKPDSLGFYEYKGDRLKMCFRSTYLGRPTSFCGGNGQHLLILHRVKPRK